MLMLLFGLDFVVNVSLFAFLTCFCIVMSLGVSLLRDINGTDIVLGDWENINVVLESCLPRSYSWIPNPKPNHNPQFHV